jgi:hypothetical protein
LTWAPKLEVQEVALAFFTPSSTQIISISFMSWTPNPKLQVNLSAKQSGYDRTYCQIQPTEQTGSWKQKIPERNCTTMLWLAWHHISVHFGKGSDDQTSIIILAIDPKHRRIRNE